MGLGVSTSGDGDVCPHRDGGEVKDDVAEGSRDEHQDYHTQHVDHEPNTHLHRCGDQLETQLSQLILIQ